MQLNKLRQVEWNGLDQVLKVYFQEELMARGLDPLGFLLQDNGLNADDVLYIRAGDKPIDGQSVDCLHAAVFWPPAAIKND